MSSEFRPDWKAYKLDELGFVGRGKSRHRPRNDPSLYGGSYPFFQTGDVKAANFYLKEYSQTYNEKGLAQSKLWNPGTLCITIAANIAETAILSIEGCFPDSIVGFIPDNSKADGRFIKYYLDTIKLRIQNVSHGATQDNLSLDKLALFDIVLPPLPTQHKIASLLSAYDELIENNTKRIKILEEMAQTIYNEWFVKFRFPGHENVKMVDSELGMIPEGWEVKELRDISTISRGKSYRSKDLVNEGGLPFINLKCIDRDGGFRYDGMKQYKGEYKESHILRTGDIVIAVTDMTQERRVVARSARIPVLKSNFGIISMDLVKIAANKLIPNDYLYGMLRYSDFADNVKQYANGTNVLHLNPEHILDFKVALAPHKLRENYSTICDYVYKELNILHLKSQNLRHTRDLLLPRLISGEIDVSELDINVEEITA